MQIKIDSNAIKQYEKKLNDLHRSAFPNAIRSTLNDAAFEMKKDNLHTSATKNFKHTRSKSFFKKFSGVKKATGWNINEMYSEIGLLDMGVKTAKTAIDNMHMHEKGGSINEGATYLRDSRTSKSFGRLVRKQNYFKRSKFVKGKNYVRKAFVALKENAIMQHGDYLIRVNKITKGRKLRINTTLLMKKRKNARITPNHFITKAGIETRKSIPLNFRKHAQKQIKKRMK